jgi:hypothetical protein
MLKIRNQQMALLSRYMEQSFEERMVRCLREFFPQRYEEFGEKRVHDLIRQGIATAATYQIIRECDVARYITLMFSLREDFDTNAETAWAAPILKDNSRSAEERLEQLYARTLEELEKARRQA